MTNTNQVTGIRFGVANGSNYPDLVDHIMMNGRDLAYEYTINQIQSSFDTLVDSEEDDIKAAIESILDDIHLYPYPSDDHLKEMVDEVLDPSSEESLGVRLFDMISDNWQYEGDPDSVSYELEEDGCAYGLSTLGGAYLIWVYYSPSIVYVNSLCSPCVPNGGDLDSGLTDAESGYECYGIPEKWM